MTILIKFFALARDAAGTAERSVVMMSGATVADAVKSIISLSPSLEPLVDRCAFAVNLTMATRSTLLRDGDELAILPPVSGG